jgi:hypothetical protein
MIVNGIERYTISDIKAANRDASQFFFSRSTMRFFDSRIERGVYCGPGGVFFVTSEQFHGSAGSESRKFTVRQFDPATAHIRTFGAFNDLLDLADARQVARDAARAAILKDGGEVN